MDEKERKEGESIERRVEQEEEGGEKDSHHELDFRLKHNKNSTYQDSRLIG